MKYYLDTEFIEDFHKPVFGKRRHYIDLISIAIVCEDGREYYAISNEFDLKYVWNKYQVKKDFGKPQDLGDTKEYWLRDNVIRPMISELLKPMVIDPSDVDYTIAHRTIKLADRVNEIHGGVSIMPLSHIVKSNAQIAEEIKAFCKPGYKGIDSHAENNIWPGGQIKYSGDPEFYAYYADYDWVLFCSLFGRMLDLPDGFPMYCIDLKQMFDQLALYLPITHEKLNDELCIERSVHKDRVEGLKTHPDYPKQDGVRHNALEDARWNKQLHEFILPLNPIQL